MEALYHNDERIAAIFSYQANENMDDGADEHSQELLDRCMQDYNALYNTAFTIDTSLSHKMHKIPSTIRWNRKIQLFRNEMQLHLFSE